MAHPRLGKILVYIEPIVLLRGCKAPGLGSKALGGVSICNGCRLRIASCHMLRQYLFDRGHEPARAHIASFCTQRQVRKAEMAHWVALIASTTCLLLGKEG